MVRRIESHFVEGPVGRLEALIEKPEEGSPVEAALVCHPHPLFGGTMHNKVVHRIARGLRRSGSVVLRFNFRGVNLSQGVHDKGVGEVEDARAALGFLRERYPALPYALAGFSFGSRVILRLGCELGCGLTEPRPARLIPVGFPTTLGTYEHLASCRVAKCFIHSTIDQFGPRPDLEAAFAGFAESKSLQFIEAGDHFFSGALDELETAIAALPR